MIEKALLIALVAAAVIMGASAIGNTFDDLAALVDVLDRVDCPKSQPNCKES